MTIQQEKWQQIWANLEDQEYRHEFATEVATTIATQIRLLREKEHWTQTELGQRTGNKEQSTISQLENPNYGRYALATLKRLATAFDVALVVRFVPFSELVDWSTNLTPTKLAPPSYSEELSERQGQIERELMLGDFSVALTSVNDSPQQVQPPPVRFRWQPSTRTQREKE